jgi:hypothetical protein
MAKVRENFKYQSVAEFFLGESLKADLVHKKGIQRNKGRLAKTLSGFTIVLQ